MGSSSSEKAQSSSSDSETRVLIAPCTTDASEGNGSLIGKAETSRLLSLRHPKTGAAACYLLTGSVVQELNWFKQPYGSWFIGEHVCEDGTLYAATRVDPIFLLLPLLKEARMKGENDFGKFRNLEEIMFLDDYPGYCHLLSIAEETVEVVCDVKEVGSLKFYRLNDSKVLAWLCCKVRHLKFALPSLDRHYAAREEQEILLDAVNILVEYLDETWLSLICHHLGLKMDDVIPVPQRFDLEALPVQNHQNGKTNGPISNKKQPKKAKTETGSRNIKDMFRRATRSSSANDR